MIKASVMKELMYSQMSLVTTASLRHGFEPLTVITKRSILNAAAALDPPLLLGKISLQSKKQLTEIFRTFNSSIGIRNVLRFRDIIPTFMNSKVV